MEPRLASGTPHAIAIALASLLATCVSGESATRSHELAVEVAMSDASVRAFYELFVPAGFDPALLSERFGLYPSQSWHEESDGHWFVLLTDGDGVQQLRDLGLEPDAAPLDSLAPADLDTLAEGVVAAQEQAFAASDEVVPSAGPGGAGPLAPMCSQIPDTFCQYTGGGPCAQSLHTWLTNLAAHPNVHLVDVSNPLTAEGRHLYGVRIGPTTLGTNVPQVLIFGAMHAREWAGSGVALELAKRLISMLEDTQNPASDWVRRVLRNRAVTIVPVANPDGYVQTFAVAAGSRDWIKNRKACLEEPPAGACPCPVSQVCVAGSCRQAGVDVARNFPFNWSDTAASCSSSSYEGPTAASEAEVSMLRKVFLDDGIGTTGDTHVTRFVLSYGAYGDYVLYPDGISAGPDGNLHSPCRTAWNAPEDCQPADFAVLRSLTGSEASPVLWDNPVLHSGPYKTDTLYRSLYPTVGDPISHFAYSPTIQSFDSLDRRALGASILLTSSAVGYYAECMAPGTWSDLVTNQMDLVRRVLENARFLESAAGAGRAPELGDHVGRRIHRQRADDESSAATYGPPRFWVDQTTDVVGMTMTPPPGFTGNTALASPAGRYYLTFSWKPSGNYIFPGWLRLCPQTGGTSCDWVIIDGGAGVNLCSQAMFPATPGWSWVPDNLNANEDCYLDVVGRNPQGGGDATWEVVRNPVTATYDDQMELDYSYRFDPGAFTATGKVQVAVRHDAGSWVTVRTYPAAQGGYLPYPSDQRFRTEIVDLPPDFDRAANLQVRIRATGVRSNLAAGALSFRAYDLVFMGRPAPVLVDAGCVSMDTVAAFDPPGTGEANDLIVVSGRSSPELCGSATLGAVQTQDLGAHVFSGIAGLTNGINDVRQLYSIGGASATTDEAFFQTSGGPGPNYTTGDPLYAPLWNVVPLGDSWPFTAPGILLDTERFRTFTQFTTGDRELGYTVQRQFQFSVDRRVGVVPIAFWKLSRLSDGVGPDLDANVVRSWLGEQAVRLTNRVWGSGHWESDLRQYTAPAQTVESVFAQCPIDRRIQHRLKSYVEAQVADGYVDAMEGANCSSAPANLDALQGVNGALVDTTPGVVNVYLINSMGAGCEQTVDAEFSTAHADRNIVFALQNVHAHLGDSGAPFVLAHELGHASGYFLHCGQGTNPACVLGDLMCLDTQCSGGVLSPGACDVLFP